MLSPLPRRSGWAYYFAHSPQPYQPSPKGLSGQPAHRPFRGLLGVHSRYGLHTRAATNSWHAFRRLQLFRHLHSCSGCFRLEHSPGGICTHCKAPPCHGAHPIAYIHPCLLLDRGTDEQLNRMAGVSRPAKIFTPKQGQYLAYIHLYTRLHRRPPAETDLQEYFRVSPPSVHQMLLTLERAGLIRRQPRTARSIELLVDPKQLPELL